MTALAAMKPLPPCDAEAQFCDAICAAGLTPPVKIIPGKLQRFSSNGKRGDDAGYYVFYSGNIPAGHFGCWRSGVKQDWRADIGRQLTPQEEREHRARMEQARRAREADEARHQTEAKTKAQRVIQNASSACEDHPYLIKKKIRPTATLREIPLPALVSIIGYQPKTKGKALTGRILIAPVTIGGELTTIEMIDEAGHKSALYGGAKRGGFWAAQALPDHDEPGLTLLTGEGVATVLSGQEATGFPAIAALSSGNLKTAALAMRAKYPGARIIILADLGNGQDKAAEAARAAGGALAVPEFSADRPAGAKDFNDVAVLSGHEAVTQIITQAVAIHDVKNVTAVQAKDGADSRVTDDVTAGANGVTPDDATGIPGREKRPCFRVFDDWQEADGVKYRPGVWYFGIKEKKEEAELTQTWICSPLYVEAVTFDAQDNNFGRLLRFRNSNGGWREWAMPMELLRASGDDLRGELLAMGVEIAPQAKALLLHYLQSPKQPKRRVRCALQTGWFDGSFVLPDRVIGKKAAEVIFQSGERGRDEYTIGGTLEDWKAKIAALAVNNPMLTLGIAAGFAGAMAEKCHVESGGIHMTGDSSCGKTTIVEAACSVWGGRNFKRSWWATANGMEGVAALFNDSLLALDEISECDPREVGAIVYALGNGVGKQRASRSGRARSVTRWRCFVLSSGERTIPTTMTEGGYRAKAGQSVRLVDMPVTRRYGAWDDLHGEASGAAFADAVKNAAQTHYGHAGRVFLERLTRDQRDFCALYERMKGLPVFSVDGDSGQEKRVSARFALAALAGELATEYGLTDWPEGTATKAADTGFKAWRNMRGGGNDERRQILNAVSAFIERHGDGRFSNADGNDHISIRDRAGWWRDDGENGRVYLFNTDGLREALKGVDFRRGLDVLQESGALPAPNGANGERAKPLRIGGRLARFYPIAADRLEAGGDGA